MSEPLTADEQAPAVRLPPAPPRLIPKAQCHLNAEAFPDPERFDPRRYIDGKPSAFAWIPFGGGTRRCAGAAFAKMEMNVVLRSVLRRFTIEATAAPGEKWRNGGGLGFTPKNGGRIVVRRRHR